MDFYHRKSNENRAVSEMSAEKRFSEILNLTHALHAENATDFASSFMKPAGSNNYASQANSPPWNDPDHAWRYVGDHVWTDEALVWAPRPQQHFRARSDTIAVEVRTTAPAPTFPDTFPHTSSSSGNRVSTASVGDVTRSQGFSAALSHNEDTQPHSQVVSFAVQSSNMGTSAPAQGVADWSDEDILLLYKWKIIKKKGNAVILSKFPGHTEESIAAAWKKYRAHGKRLYDETKRDGRRSSSFEA